MKIKNIMFTGFMAAILMSATGTASAAISVASQGYVDAKVGTATTSIETLTGTVAANKEAAETAIAAAQKAGDDAAAALESYKTTNDGKVTKNTEDIAKNAAAIATEKTDRETAVSGLDTRLDTAEETISGHTTTIGEHTTAIQGINEELGKMATSETVTDLTTDVGALKTQVGEGNVADRIADAVAAEASAREAADEGLQADIDAINDEENGILKQAQTYADGLGVKYDAAGAAEAAQADAEATAAAALNAYKTTNDAAVQKNATDIKTNADAIVDINAELDTMASSETVTALTTRVGTAESDIDALQAEDIELSGAIATNVQGIADNKSAIERIEEAYIAKPDACQNTYCVLSVNGENISWMPLTEPVDDFMDK